MLEIMGRRGVIAKWILGRTNNIGMVGWDVQVFWFFKSFLKSLFKKKCLVGVSVFEKWINFVDVPLFVHDYIATL